MPIILILCALLLPALHCCADEVALALNATGQHDVELAHTDPDLWQMTSTGTDPYVLTVPQTAAFDLTRTPMLSFEYISITGIDDLQVFIGQPWKEEHSLHAGPMPPRQGWSEFSVELTHSTGIRQLRLDIGDKSGAVVQLRHVHLRAYSPEESEAALLAEQRRDEDIQRERDLKAYLQQAFPSRLDRVVAAADTIDITASAVGDGVVLAEWPAWVPLVHPLHLDVTFPLVSGGPGGTGSSHVSVPRFVQGYDRVLSRFVLVRRSPRGDELMSHARWADSEPAAGQLPEQKPRTKKGLGGFHAGMLDSDLDDLGISAVTVNISVAQLLKAEASAGTMEVTSFDHTWHVSREAVAHLDSTMLAAAKRNIVVLGIILIDKAKHWASPELGRIFQHPDYQPQGIFSMANVSSQDGISGYAAMMGFLAERYSRADGAYGRIHHWIIHNEVDMGWVWTNCGARPEHVYLDQYYKALRIAYYEARRFDAHARVYISLTQWWNQSEDNVHCHPSHALLDDLTAFSTAEGDFDWGVAYHPYPDSLFEPKSWLDRTSLFALDTPKITFRNIEVLDAWARMPANRYLGTTVRSIHLSEQGPNAKDYSPQALTEQAASMAYVWKKISVLDSIEAFEYHNWVDNRGEGGLRIGLRRFPDDAQSPMGPKPVWHLYRALGTAVEDAACAFALPVIGISSWDEVHQRGQIVMPH